MADEQTQVDTSGITRSADGTISDGQTTQSDQGQSSQSTNPETKDGTTLLTEGKKAETEVKAEEGEKKPETKAPEKYEDYKLPDGLTLDAEVKGKADALFKGLGLDQAQAQSLVDFYGDLAKTSASAPIEAYKAVTDAWKADAESHPDLRGKLGPGKEVNVRISRALDGLGDPKLVSDFKQLMDLTGAGNNQAFIRVLDRFAQKVSEGTHVVGNNPSTFGQTKPGTDVKPSAAAAMWPNLSGSR